MSLDLFLNLKQQQIIEGHTQQVDGQIKDLINIVTNLNKSNINIMEIGFNAGHSADIFLNIDNSITLTSFDIGDHSYFKVGKEYIDNRYPKRHILIIGDSTKSIPAFSQVSNTTFDVIFIDGGHEYSIALADIENCKKLAHKDTIVIMDDTIYNKNLSMFYNTGPTQAWTEFVDKKKILEIDRVEYQLGRGMSYGKYVFE
jgi:predicted O-methyltransferase YrrM